MGDAWKFRDDRHKMMYITPLLEGNAHRMIYPYIVNDRINFITIKKVWHIFDCAYDDPDCQGTAERELAMLKQGTREFLAYFANFQCIMAELQLDPFAKSAGLHQGMAGKLEDLLVSYDCPDDWAQYIWLLQCLDFKLRQCDAEKRKETSNTPSRTTPAALSSSTTPSSTTHITSNLTYLGPALMNYSVAQKQAERERIN